MSNSNILSFSFIPCVLISQLANIVYSFNWTHTKLLKQISAYERKLNLLKFANNNVTNKNPAYGRQGISRPMQIVAPIP